MKKIFLSILLFSEVLFSQNIHDIRILHWNDFHARNAPYKVTKKDSLGNETVYLVGGTANLLGYLNQYRNNNSIVLNAGDDFQGTPISTITRGKSQIELLNLFDLDAFVPGNHEFDYSQYALDSALWIANFEVLLGNVYDITKHTTFGKPYSIKDINGVKTGIIGITTPELLQLSLPQNVNNIKMLNTDSVIDASITVLKKENADLIILLSHSGIETDKEFAKKFSKDLDIIVGGHSHTALQKPKVQDGVLIVQAGSLSRWLGLLDIKVDTDKDTIISFTGELVEVKDDDSIKDKQAEGVVDILLGEINAELMKVIGKLESDWIQSYSEESNVGQWNAEVYRNKTNSDIAFMNGGGIRKSLSKGDITINDMWELNPFGNVIVTFEVNGKTLEEMMNNFLKLRAEGMASNKRVDMLNLAGMNCYYETIDSDTSISVVKIIVGGNPIDENKIYKISVNNYIASQFQKFFGEVDEKITFEDTKLIDRDVLIEAVREREVINTPLENKIIEVTK